MPSRLDVAKALEDLESREDGITFQRLCRGLLRSQFSGLVPHSEHKDLGRDASIWINGEAVAVACSLTATLSKIRSDITRIRQTEQATKVFFCTSRRVSNARIAAWCQRINDEFEVDLVILERSWLEDECLRPHNHVLVRDELRVHLAPMRSAPSIQFGEVQVLSGNVKPVSDIVSLQVAGVGSLVAWSTPPSAAKDEEVTLAVMKARGKVEFHVVPGSANPALLFHEGTTYLSTMRRVDRRDTWETTIWTVDNRGISREPISWFRERNLCHAPRLVVVEDGPATVILRSTEDLERVEVIVWGLDHVIARRELASRRRDLAVATHAGVSYVVQPYHARSEPDEPPIGLEILRCYGDHLELVVNVPVGAPSTHVAATSFEDCILVVSAAVSGYLEAVLIRPRDGAEIGRRYITAKGTYPALANSGGRPIVCWVGTPPPPIEYQLRNFEFFQAAAFVEVVLGAAKAEAQLSSSGRDLVDQNWRAARIEAHNSLEGLWTGMFTPEGACIGVPEPLGLALQRSVLPSISVEGYDGVIAWSTSVPDGGGVVVGRRVEVSW